MIFKEEHFMMKKILIGLVVVIGVILIIAALKPADYTVSREITINAPADKIFPYINDAKKMDSWNPWTEVDPNAKMTFSGPEAGVGAKASWDSKGQLGVGSATVIESVPNSVVKTQLEYTKPFAMLQIEEISLTPNGSQTNVRWSVNGQSALMCRVACLFMNMDKMVGGTFEKGLNKLKTIVESQKP